MQGAHKWTSVADTDLRFLILRSDVRDLVRRAEGNLRDYLQRIFDQFPSEVRSATDEIIPGTASEVLTAFLPFLAGYSTVLDQAEALAEDIRRAQQSKLN